VSAIRKRFTNMNLSTLFMLPRMAEYQSQASHPETSRDSQPPSTQSSHRNVIEASGYDSVLGSMVG
jgi:hypothetical protein